ncbi:MAG: PASTA domain-containing protein [Deltaproteobacteria bacterium]|nr:PASTA domain-containing protein [Deltaproteobacteria bacterium]
MRRVVKTAALLCVFFGVAGISAYFTLRFIIKSEDTVIVPELVGRDVVYALDLLTDLGLNIKVSGFEYRSDVPKNHVAYQHPGPGSEVKKDRDVRIVISKGPKNLFVPNLVGMDIRQAHIIMEENGLSRGVVSRTFSDRVAEDEIVGHAPPSGTVVSRGDSMDLLVSLGSRPVTYQMPYLHGLALEDAILILEKVHLGLGQIKSVQSNDLPMDVVVEQSPLAGYQVTAGTLVNLTMNRAKGVVLGRGLSLFHHRTHQGFLKKHIRFRVNTFGMVYDLYDGFVHPGEGIWLLAPEEPEATVFLYENGELVLSHSLSNRSREDIMRDLAMDWD